MKTLRFIFLLVIIILSWHSANAGQNYTLKVGDQQMLSFTPKNGVLFNSMSWRSYDTRCVRVDGPQYTSYTYVTALEPTTSSRGALVQCEYKYQVGRIYMTATEDFYIKVEENKSQEPTGIYIQSSLSLVVGERHTITPAIEPPDATTNVSWSTSDSGVASVTSSGTVIANAPGTAYITVRTDNGYSSKCCVTVSKPTVSLSASAPSGLYPTGTKVALKATPSNATIYYTLDGSIPTTTSTVYTDSIILNGQTTLNALAICNGYENSNIVNRDYNTTSLLVIGTYPENNVSLSRPNMIPSINFNENIFEGDNFSQISLTLNNLPIDGNVKIYKNLFYFMPDRAIPIGDICLNVPEGALVNSLHEPNLALQLHFNLCNLST